MHMMLKQEEKKDKVDACKELGSSTGYKRRERERENVNWLSVGATNKSHSIIEATWHAN